MIVQNDEFQEERKLIESTTIKTIRNLKSRQSYNNMLSSRDDYTNSNDNTNIPPQTPSQHEDDTNDKPEELPKHKKSPSMPNSFIKNPLRKSTKLKAKKLNSETLVNGEDTQKDESNQDSESNGDQTNTMQQFTENGTTTINSTKNGKQSGKSSSMSKGLNRGFSSMTQHINIENKIGLQQQQQQKEYVAIDMEYAIQFVLTKSKTLKDKIETQGIHQAFITQHFTKNKFFNISYNYFLQNLINHKVLNAEFKNVTKKMFEKLENFFFDRLNKCQETIAVQQNYVKKSKGVYSALDKRIQELKKELTDKNKIEL